MATIPRTRSAAVGLGVLLLALVVVIALHRFEPVGYSALAGKILRSLHGPGFAAIAIAVGLGARDWADGWWRIVLAFAVCVSISLLSELSQVPGPRNAEVADLVVDGAGILAGLALVAGLDSSLNFGTSPWTRRAVALASALALIAIAMPTLQLTAAISVRNANFPVLLSFESTLERELYAGMQTPPPVRVPKPKGWPTDGVMIGNATASGRWGTMLALAPYHDWKDYAAVSFVVASGNDEPVDIGVMLRSEKKSFYRQFTAGPDPRRVRIAFADIIARRPDFDLSDVRTLVVSAAEPGEPYEVLFDDFRLED
ncbi:MAG: hypothetical protein EX272_07515 [Chromatiales bacterium]|nr:MAG: hypothetical protein EX272_07515 [Chromatiales bacterium]